VNKTYQLNEMTITCCFSEVQTLLRNFLKKKKKEKKWTK